MQKADYKSEQIWLRNHFEHISTIDFDLSFESAMIHLGVSLAEALDILRNGQVVFAEKETEFCCFITKGRNCDDEEITIGGAFDSGTQQVSLNHIEKKR